MINRHWRLIYGSLITCGLGIFGFLIALIYVILLHWQPSAYSGWLLGQPGYPHYLKRCPGVRRSSPVQAAWLLCSYLVLISIAAWLFTTGIAYGVNVIVQFVSHPTWLLLVSSQSKMFYSEIAPSIWEFALFFIAGIVGAYLFYRVIIAGALIDDHSAQLKLLPDIEGFRRRIQQIVDFQKLTPAEFEELVSVYFTSLGYKSTVVGRTNDGGIDIELEKEGERSIVQCKRYKGTIGRNLVDEVFGTFVRNQDAREAYLFTGGKFSQTAREIVATLPGLTLVDGATIIKLLHQIKKTKNNALTPNHQSQINLPSFYSIPFILLRDAPIRTVFLSIISISPMFLFYAGIRVWAYLA